MTIEHVKMQIEIEFEYEYIDNENFNISRCSLILNNEELGELLKTKIEQIKSIGGITTGHNAEVKFHPINRVAHSKYFLDKMGQHMIETLSIIACMHDAYIVAKKQLEPKKNVH